MKTLYVAGSKHPGIYQIMQDIRRKHSFPSNAKCVRNWVQQCRTCIKDKRIKNTKLIPELLNVSEWDMEPEDAIQIYLHPELPPIEGYENNITLLDVFSRCA